MDLWALHGQAEHQFVISVGLLSFTLKITSAPILNDPGLLWDLEQNTKLTFISVFLNVDN